MSFGILLSREQLENANHLLVVGGDAVDVVTRVGSVLNVEA